MNDMSQVIIPRSDQINADDLLAGPMTITINEVRIKAGEEQPVDIYFEGSKKAYRPCKSMSRVLVAVWGPDAGKYVGRSLTLYRDPAVRFGKDAVGGIRISHMTDIPKDRLDDGRVIMSLTATRAQRKPHVVRPLVLDQQQSNQGGNDEAGKWANQYLAKVGTFTTIKALNEFANGKATMLAKLESVLPNAHRQCVAALDNARAAFSEKDGFGDFNEGPDHSQQGESFTDENAPDVRDQVAANIRQMIENAMGPSSLEAASAEFDKHEVALPSDVAEELAEKLAAKRRELAEG